MSSLNCHVWWDSLFTFKYKDMTRNVVVTKEFSFFPKHFLIPISEQPNVVDLHIFQTMNSVRSKNQSLRYKRFTLADCKDIGTTKF